MAHPTHRIPSQPFDRQKWLILIGLSLVAGASAWYLSWRAPQPITISVPGRNLPVYHLITSTDLMTISILPAKLPSEAMRSEPELVGHYIREPLTTGKAVLRAQLVPFADPTLNITTTVVSVPATGAMAFGGRLTSGDVVALWEVPSMTNTVTSTTHLLLDQALVLAVLPASSAPAAGAEEFPYVVILAIPIDRQAEILTIVAAESLAFTLNP